MALNCTFILLSVLCVVSVCSKKLPPYLTLCHRHDPDLEKCLRNAVEQLRPHLPEGIPELLIPRGNPLLLPEAGLDNGNNFNASFKNIEIYYANEFKIDHLGLDLDKLNLNLTLTFPRIRIRSQYNIDGRLLVLQLQGHGPADGNFSNVVANVQFSGELYPKKGKEYVDFKLNKLDLHLGKPVFQFDDIFRDNDELNVRTNKIINENIVDILDELKPIIQKTVTQFTLAIVGRIFNRFSFDELFPK